MMTGEKRKKTAFVIAGGLIGTVLGVTVANVATAQFAGPEPTSYVGSTYDLGLLYEGEAAELPTELRQSEMAETMDLASLRLVESDSDSSTYVAVGERGMLCMIVFLGGAEWTASTACAGPDRFADGGLGVRTTGEVGAIEQYLVSDSAKMSDASDSLARSTYTQVGSNLYEVDPMLNKQSRLKVADLIPEIDIITEWSE
jgi:hypothetical protein